jgi:hypothetical protein
VHCIPCAANRRISTVVENLCAGGADIAFDVADPWIQQNPWAIGCYIDKGRIHRRQCMRHPRFDRGPCPGYCRTRACEFDGPAMRRKGRGPQNRWSALLAKVIKTTYSGRCGTKGFGYSLSQPRIWRVAGSTS